MIKFCEHFDDRQMLSRVHTDRYVVKPKLTDKLKLDDSNGQVKLESSIVECSQTRIFPSGQHSNVSFATGFTQK